MTGKYIWIGNYIAYKVCVEFNTVNWDAYIQIIPFGFGIVILHSEFMK